MENEYVVNCSRCSRQGLSGTFSDMFDVRPGAFHAKFAKNDKEEFVCDPCLLNDPNFRKEYGIPDPRSQCRK